jgi:hypothetical protein
MTAIINDFAAIRAAGEGRPDTANVGPNRDEELRRLIGRSYRRITKMLPLLVNSGRSRRDTDSDHRRLAAPGGGRTNLSPSIRASARALVHDRSTPWTIAKKVLADHAETLNALAALVTRQLENITTIKRIDERRSLGGGEVEGRHA